MQSILDTVTGTFVCATACVRAAALETMTEVHHGVMTQPEPYGAVIVGKCDASNPIVPPRIHRDDEMYIERGGG